MKKIFLLRKYFLVSIGFNKLFDNFNFSFLAKNFRKACVNKIIDYLDELKDVKLMNYFNNLKKSNLKILKFKYIFGRGI